MNTEWLLIVLVAWLAGISAFVGGVLAWWQGELRTLRQQELAIGISAYGGGVLLAAVAFALVPTGMELLSPLSLAVSFCLGGGLFAMLDARISRGGGSKAQFMAMLIDFVPEALAFGALFAVDPETGVLLAVFIGIQNLPEGFNAYREINAINQRPGKTLRALLAVSFLGPLAAAAGYGFLQGAPVVTAAIMSFAGGGILYLIFQDIAPQSRMQQHWAPPLGAVLGFMTGMLGKQLLG